MPAVPLSRCPDVLYAPSLLIIECGAVAEDFLLDSLDGIGFSAKCSQAKPISYRHTHTQDISVRVCVREFVYGCASKRSSCCRRPRQDEGRRSVRLTKRVLMRVSNLHCLTEVLPTNGWLTRLEKAGSQLAILLLPAKTSKDFWSPITNWSKTCFIFLRSQIKDTNFMTLIMIQPKMRR